MATAVRRSNRATSNAHSVFETLRDRITSHHIPPGAKLAEQQLAKEFGISRARIREVFSSLEARGLIQRIPNRGAVVSKLELNQVFEIYDAREALEGMCTRLATQNVAPESWQDMVDLYAPGGQMETYLAQGDMESFLAQYSALRRRVIEAANNPILAQMLDSILDKSRVIMRRVLILPGRAQRGLAEHRAVLAAMRAGNAEEAERLKRENIRSAASDLKRYQAWVL